MSKSPYRPHGLLPRCRLFASSPRSRGEGWGCSPIKAERELGLDRRETGRILSNGAVGSLRAALVQYERNNEREPLV